VKHLLDARREYLMPRLEGAVALEADAVGPKAVVARWRMGDGRVLMLALNLDGDSLDVASNKVPIASGSTVLFETEGAAESALRDELPGYAFIAVLGPARD
jgi:maltooligosyltrehalose trehalohydrolase